MTSFWEWLNSERGQILITGGAGATAAVLHRWPGPVAALRFIIIGTMVAYYLGPSALHIFAWLSFSFDIPKEHVASAGVFIVGATGSVIFETIVLAIALRSKSIKHKSKEHCHGSPDVGVDENV